MDASSAGVSDQAERIPPDQVRRLPSVAESRYRIPRSTVPILTTTREPVRLVDPVKVSAPMFKSWCTEQKIAGRVIRYCMALYILLLALFPAHCRQLID